jgi:hypothetical protein
MIPVYRQEITDKIDHLIKDSGRILVASSPQLTEPFKISEEIQRVVAGFPSGNPDSLTLHYLTACLVSVGWNKNDDVFDPTEVWNARSTPEDTPFNLEHNCADIIGHITGSRVVDAEGQVVPMDCPVDDLPAKFHIHTSAVLYKLWDKPELQERMDKLIADIRDGQYFVSMECYFRGFDYALRAANGECRVIARNQQTAFLTKYLRVYGGAGTYQNQQVGRLLRNVVFAGKGLVKNPANPESIIFAQSHEAFKSLGYYLIVPPMESQKNMEHEAELTAAKAANASLQTSLDQARAEAKQAAETLTSQLAAANTQIAEMTAQLNAIKAEQARASRLAQLKAAMKVDETNTEAVQAAETLVTSLAGLSDEQFTAYVAAQAALAPKATPAPLPPKATPAPEAPKVMAAAQPVITNTQVQPEPALAVAPEVDAVAKTRLAIASLFTDEKESN